MKCCGHHRCRHLTPPCFLPVATRRHHHCCCRYHRHHRRRRCCRCLWRCRRLVRCRQQVRCLPAVVEPSPLWGEAGQGEVRLPGGAARRFGRLGGQPGGCCHPRRHRWGPFHGRVSGLRNVSARVVGWGMLAGGACCCWQRVRFPVEGGEERLGEVSACPGGKGWGESRVPRSWKWRVCVAAWRGAALYPKRCAMGEPKEAFSGETIKPPW